MESFNLRPPPSPKTAARVSGPKAGAGHKTEPVASRWVYTEGNAGHEAGRAAVCRQAGRRWRAWACRGTLVATVRTAAEEPSARRGGASSYRPPVRTLTYFMPEIFKLFLSNRPIDYRKTRVTTELNHATVSITHPRFHKKERRASRMSPASKPSGGHTARK